MSDAEIAEKISEDVAKKAGIDEQVADAIGDVAESVVATGKKWFRSKTVWTNIIAAVAIAAQSYYGFVFPVEWEAGMLAVVNLGLRYFTKEELI